MTRSRLLLALLLSLAAGTTASAKPAPSPLPKGLPPALQQRLRAHPPPRAFRIDASVRPLYLRGDFDGAGTTEFAVVLAPKTSGPDDIFIYLGDGRPRLLSRDLGGHDWPGPDWRLHPKGQRVPQRADINGEAGFEPHAYPALVGDAIEVSKPESSSALVYWRKGRFHIYWLSD